MSERNPSEMSREELVQLNDSRGWQDCTTAWELRIRHELFIRLAREHCSQDWVLRGRLLKLQRAFERHLKRVRAALAA